jgi:DDE superfamily endonuclease
VWWSRLAQPSLHTWTAADQPPLRLLEQAVAPHAADPKARACYGVLLRRGPPTAHEANDQLWLRFVDGRPVSARTTPFLDWCCARLEQQGVPVWALVWDNASWQVSKAVRSWLRTHNRQVKQCGQRVRILACYLPVKSPWLNPIEPKWVHGKRAIVAPTRLLSSHEVAERVCSYFDCPHEDHLIQEKAG